MKAFAVVRIRDGHPDFGGLEYKGYILCDRIPSTQWGAYLVSGTEPQLLAIDALSDVVGICVLSSGVGTDRPELDDVVTESVRTNLNTWLSNRGLPTIPVYWTNRQVIQAIFLRANDRFDIKGIDVADVEE